MLAQGFFGGKLGGLGGLNSNFFLVKNGLPTDGLIATLQNSNGHFLGKYNTKGATLDLVPEAQGWERWIFYQRGNGTFSIKQETSGLFLGGTKGNGENPKLAEKEDAWEKFVIEPKGNNSVAIRNIDGNYLSRNLQKSVWTNQPSQDALWRILPVADQPNTNATNKITLAYFEGLPSIGDRVTLANAKGGYLGSSKDVGQDIGIADNAAEWEDIIFEIVGDKVALKNAVSNNYVGKVCDKGQVVQWAQKRDAWELLTIQNVGNGVVAFKNWKGLYLSSQNKKVVWTDTYGMAEQWKFMPDHNLLKMGVRDLNQRVIPSQGGQSWGQQQTGGGFGGNQGNQGQGWGSQSHGHGHGHGHGQGFNSQGQGQGFNSQGWGQQQGGFGGQGTNAGFGGQGQVGFGGQGGWGQQQGNQGWGQQGKGPNSNPWGQ